MSFLLFCGDCRYQLLIVRIIVCPGRGDNPPVYFLRPVFWGWGREKKICRIRICVLISFYPGAIAQLGERLHGMQEVVGSNPIGSIIQGCSEVLVGGELRMSPFQQILSVRFPAILRRQCPIGGGFMGRKLVL